jgi:hypothetical protein
MTGADLFARERAPGPLAGATRVEITRVLSETELPVREFEMRVSQLWETERFSEIVFKAGFGSSACTSRGRDVLAARSRLKSESGKRREARMMLEESLAGGRD